MDFFIFLRRKEERRKKKEVTTENGKPNSTLISSYLGDKLQLH